MNTPLPPHDPRDPHDALPGEAELRARYRQLPAPEPSAALDDAVHRMAAAALAGAAPATSQRRARWPLALATAATLMLAVGLGWQMREMPSAGHAPAAAAPSFAATDTGAAQTPASAPASAAPMSVMKASAPRHVERITAQAQTPQAQAAAAYRAQNSPQPLLMTLPRSASVSDRPAASTRALSRMRSTEMIAAPAPAVPPAPPAPPAPPNDPQTAGITATPEQQLDAIRVLFAQGHADEARQQLARFHREHPHWELPPELRTELPQP
jgi:Meckel syndrome type 1 protein